MLDQLESNGFLRQSDLDTGLRVFRRQAPMSANVHDLRKFSFDAAIS